MNTLREIQDNIIAVEQEKDAMEKDQLENKKTLLRIKTLPPK